jgi:hypothetical protein
MSYRFTFVLTVIAVVMAGLIFLRPSVGNDETANENPWFYLVDDTKVDRIAVDYFGQQETFVRDETRTWHVGSLEGPAVGPDFQGTPFLAAGARSPRIIAEEASEEELALYGLDDPKIKMEVHLEDGIEYLVLLGNLTPDRINNYAQVEGYPGVYLVDRTWGEHMAKLVTDTPLPTPTAVAS